MVKHWLHLMSALVILFEDHSQWKLDNISLKCHNFWKVIVSKASSQKVTHSLLVFFPLFTEYFFLFLLLIFTSSIVDNLWGLSAVRRWAEAVWGSGSEHKGADLSGEPAHLFCFLWCGSPQSVGGNMLEWILTVDVRPSADLSAYVL